MRISTPSRNKLLAVVGALVMVLSSLTVARPQARQRFKFVGVNLDDDTMKADRKLVTYLRSNTGLEIGEEPQEQYGRMIRKLVAWKSDDEPYLARVTPYVYVAAQMLGAEFEVLATYKNMSDSTIYYSYFVVNREEFPSEPTLDQLMQALKTRNPPARFIYHDRFSTSSYFLPSLMFRSQYIFAMDKSRGNLTAIRSDNINANAPGKFSSSELVRQVANKEANLAAVWDGTKRKFEGTPEASKVHFVKIPNVLPNDLLVCSTHLDTKTKDALREAVRKMKSDQIHTGDFNTWVDISFEPDAQEALAGLRHSAEQRPAPITVRIENSQPSPVSPSLLDTIKHAVQLSRGELVLWDKDYHKKVDVDWKVEAIHDGAISLISSISDSNLDSQRFEISFTDDEDLIKRIGGIIQSRMDRISYIWPYDDHYPTVIRDADFPVSPNAHVKVMRVTWNDPQRNDFLEDDAFDATVVNPTLFGFQLASTDFQKTGDAYNFDPMSNISYRVILARPTHESLVFTILTYVFVGLLVLAAIGAVFDMRRRAKELKDVPRVSGELFNESCRELANNYRSSWRNHELTEADVLWCDRPSLEKLIADLKVTVANPAFDAVKNQTRSMSILASIPLLNKFGAFSVGTAVNVTTITDPAKFSDAQRLADTIDFLFTENAFSPFIGEKLEWDALNKIAYDIFKPVTLETSQNGVNGDGLIRSEHPMLLSLIAKHFNGVIQESKQKVCFFNKNWEVTENETEKILACTAELLSPLKLNGGDSTVQKLILRARVSRDAELGDLSQGNEVSAWLIGKIHRVELPRNGDRTLFLNFRPAALVKTDDSQ